MKRDMDLIRGILLEVESQPSFPCVIKYPGIDYHTADYHLRLLEEEGFVTGTFVNAADGLPYLFRSITWKGCEFLDAARSDEVWEQANEKISKTVGSVSISVLTAVLIDIAKQKLGIQ